MTDRDKVIKWLEMCPGILECSDNPRTECPYEENGCVGDLKAEVLALLKEQEQTINALESDLKETLEVVAEQSNVVRCKDCKWWHESEREEGFGDCGQANGITLKQSNWFCADGVAKDTDVTHRCDGCQYHAPEGYCRYFIGCPYKDN